MEKQDHWRACDQLPDKVAGESYVPLWYWTCVKPNGLLGKNNMGATVKVQARE
jgi:hypothetical protein